MDGASGAVNYLLETNGGDLKGKKLALVYHNSAFGKEPIRTLEELSKKHGYELTLLPVDHPGQEQKSQWLQIRRERPDFVIMYGWGVMNQVAIQEAANIRFPMENFIGIWWSGGEHDVLPAGDGANGYKALTFHAVGDDFPVFDDIKTYVSDKGKAAGNGDLIGGVIYNRGLYAAMLAAEAIKDAQAATGNADVTPGDVRDAMENLNITEERMAGLGMPNFGPSFHVSCENHGGSGLVGVAQWDATSKKWSMVSDFKPTDREVIGALVKEDSEAFAKENNIASQCK